MSLPINLSYQLTEDQWQGVRSKFLAEGIDVPDEASGSIYQMGVECGFTWDGKTLRVSVNSKPWWLSDRRVTDGLNEFIMS